MRLPLDPVTNKLSGQMVDAAFQVHRELGPGLIESVYEHCFAAELRHRGIAFVRQAPIQIIYRDVSLDAGLRLDFLVENVIVLELKAVEELHPVHSAQLLSYLRLANKPLGLLINFNVIRIRDGIERIINPSRPIEAAVGSLVT
jgi:GxxExxY protein